MLTAVIKGPSIQEAEAQIDKASPYANAYEFRLDFFSHRDLSEIKKLKERAKGKVIFTLRGNGQKEEERLQEIEKLAALNPDFFDIESDVPLSFFKKIRNSFPEVQIIVSHHDFEKTPVDLMALLKEMEKPFFAIYKIACLANSASDLLRMLSFIKEASQTIKIIGISMGEYGEPSRVLGKVLGNFLSYGSIEKENEVLHQLTLEELTKIYHFQDLNADTLMFSLLGDPVEQSKGHLFYNRIFREGKRNAVYVKCKAKKEEVQEFFKDSLFQGFAITMPLKEAVMPYIQIDPSAQKIGAVNTVAKRSGKFVGFNTDAPGALDAIEEETFVRGRKMVVLGTGGAAKAIAYEAKMRGAEVWIAGRSLKKADAMAKYLGCKSVSLSNLPPYDILVNATSAGMKDSLMPIEEKEIQEGTVVMDVVYSPQFTPLLQAAQKKGCISVFGYSMFENQALFQEKLWFS